MARANRCLSSGRVYHVLNRAVRRHQLFETDRDYQHFQRLIGAAQARVPVRLLAYCIMPNHWHLVVWPEDASAVPAYMRWLTWSHACHFNALHGLSGHVYQGRYRSVVVRDERQLLTLLRYVEANPVRARLVDRAESWRWSSLHSATPVVISESPVCRPSNWLDVLAEKVPHPTLEVPGAVKSLNSTWHRATPNGG